MGTMKMENKGQALVEFALIAMVLVVLTLGIFEFGRAMYIKNTLNNAARAAARVAVVTPGLVSPVSQTGCGTPANNTGVYQMVCDSLYNGINPAEIQTDINVYNSAGTLKTTTALSPPQNGDEVRISVTWGNFRPVTGIISITNNLTGQASMRYE